MGRYYSGDIEGKFWFAVQPSNAADRFGIEGENTHISYNFGRENLSDIKSELNRIRDTLGKNKDKLDKFFEKHFGYTDSELMKYLKCDESKLRFLLREYADLQLGTEIEKCIEDTGYCSFDAEL